MVTITFDPVTLIIGMTIGFVLALILGLWIYGSL